MNPFSFLRKTTCRHTMAQLQRNVAAAQAKHDSARISLNTRLINETQKKLHAANHALMAHQLKEQRK